MSQNSQLGSHHSENDQNTEPTWDVILCSYSNLATDGRTRNILTVLRDNGLRVLCLVPASSAPFDGVDVCFVPECPFSERHVIRWWYFVRAARKILVDGNYTCHVLVAEDLYSLPITSWYAKKCNAKSVYDSREIFSALGALTNRFFAQSILTQIEKKYTKNCSSIFVSGYLDAIVIQDHLQRTEKPHVILNVPPLSLHTKEQSTLRTKLGCESTIKLVVYQGVVVEGRGIAPLLEALTHTHDDIHAVIIGDGLAMDQYRALCTSLGVDNRVYWLGSVAYDSLAELTAGADIGWCFIEPISLSYELALPNKLFEYMMARLPIIVSDLPALADIFNQYRCGVVASRHCTAKELAKAIEQCLDEQIPFSHQSEIASRIFNRAAQESVILQAIWNR